MDQLQALRVFVRIADAGTFTKAADSLNIPRPTATKLIQELESHLGVKLLQRTTRRVSVTPEGAAYHERATHLIAELEEMDALVSNARAQPKGRLRIDIGSSLANLILIPALPDFHARYPEIQLDLGVGDRPVDLVGEGVDCVIRGGALADTALVARRIANFDYLTVATPDYVARQGLPAHPCELADPARGHALVSYFSSLTGRPFPLFFRNGTESLEIHGRSVVSVNDSSAHLNALLSGLGVTQTFGFMALPHIRAGSLTRLLPAWDRPRHPLHVVYPGNRHLNAKLRVFVDWVAAVFAPFDDRRG